MPSLLDRYKEYKKLLDQLNEALTKLEKQGVAIRGFLDREATSYSQIGDLDLVRSDLVQGIVNIRDKIRDAKVDLNKTEDPEKVKSLTEKNS